MAAGRGTGEPGERTRDKLEEAVGAVWRSPALVRVAEWLIRALLGAALAGGRVLGGASPFGVALVGACGPGVGGLAGLLGAVSGYLLSRGLEEGLRYAAASILVFSVSFAFYDVKLYKKSWFMPVAAALLNGCAGLVTLTGKVTGAAVAGFLGEMVLTGGAVYFFRIAFSPWDDPQGEGETTFRQRVSLLLLGAAVLVSLEGLTVMGWLSVGRMVAVYAVLTAGWTGGIGAGAAVGVAAGLAMDLTAGAAPFYTMAYGFMGVVCGVTRRQRRLLCAMAGWTSTLLILLWGGTWGGPLWAMWEVAAAAVAFVLTPSGLARRLSALFVGDESADGAGWAAGEAARKLRATAAAFGDLFGELRGAFGKRLEGEEDPGIIFDQAANRVCAKCPMRERCWQTGYTDTYNCLDDALPQLLDQGRGEPAMFPQRFRDRCAKFPAFLSAVNEELAAFLARRRYQSGLGESRRAVCRQYGDMAQVLEETAEAMAVSCVTDAARTRRLQRFLTAKGLSCQGLAFYDEANRLRVQVEGRRAEEVAGEESRRDLERLLSATLAPAETSAAPRGGRVVYREAASLAATAGMAGRKKPDQTVSGDAGGWFKDGEGKLLLILCDGMGSGPEARRESDLTLGLLEKFLRAGVHPELALKTLNEALVLRGEETGGFSTVDLLSLDLYTGRAVLYKLGAAPSYLRRGGCVTKLSGDALPAGLALGEGRGPDKSEFQMDPGDCLVMLTDGVIGEADAWVREALAGFDGGTPQALAQQLVDHEPDGQDDRTAMVLRVGLREGT